MCRGRAAALLAAAVTLLAGCGGEPADDAGMASSRAPASLLWRELGEWAGRGERQTESFDIASGALRLTWSALDADERGASSLRVTLHSAISGRPLEAVVDHLGTGSDTVRFTAGPRVAYLLIESSGVDWSVRLEEAVAARTEAPP